MKERRACFIRRRCSGDSHMTSMLRYMTHKCQSIQWSPLFQVVKSKSSTLNTDMDIFCIFWHKNWTGFGKQFTSFSCQKLSRIFRSHNFSRDIASYRYCVWMIFYLCGRYLCDALGATASLRPGYHWHTHRQNDHAKKIWSLHFLFISILLTILPVMDWTLSTTLSPFETLACNVWKRTHDVLLKSTAKSEAVLHKHCSPAPQYLQGQSVWLFPKNTGLAMVWRTVSNPLLPNRGWVGSSNPMIPNQTTASLL